MKFTDCEKSGVECFALVKSCDKKSAKNGSLYLDIVLCDKDSEIVAKFWDFKEGVNYLPVANAIIKARGTVQQYNGADQFIIQRMRAVTDSDGVEIKDFVKSADFSGEEMFNALKDIVSEFEDADLRAVCGTLLDENKEKLLFFPAAEKLHHAMNGGLLYHTLTIVRLAQCVAVIYPVIDKDLLLCGAILHDIAKLKEYTVNGAGMIDGHTLEGMLLGHLVMGAEDVGRVCDKLGVNEEKKILLQHMLVSHHGKLEFGAAVRPAFVEADILSQLDLLDANIYEMADALKGTKQGDFTGRLWMLDNRRFYNHGRTEVEPKAKLF